MPDDIYIYVTQNNCNQDLSKNWYIYYKIGEKKTKKYGNLNRIQDVQERQRALDELQAHHQYLLDKEYVYTIKRQLYDNLEALREKKEWRKKTYQTHKSKLDKLAEFAEERKSDITKTVINAFLQKLRKEKHGVTYNRYCAEIRRWLVDIDKLDLMPPFDRKKAKSKPARFLQSHQMKMLQANIMGQDPELWLAIQYMYNCAIRPGELRLLQAMHIMLDEEKIWVTPEISKTGIERYARIPKKFLPELQYIKTVPPSNYLFTSPRNDAAPTGVNYFSRKIRAFMDDLGFDSSFKPCYSWRHTAAMNGVKDKIPYHQMKDQWGHASLDQFIQYIRQFGVDDRDEFAEKFSAI